MGRGALARDGPGGLKGICLQGPELRLFLYSALLKSPAFRISSDLKVQTVLTEPSHGGDTLGGGGEGMLILLAEDEEAMTDAVAAYLSCYHIVRK